MNPNAVSLLVKNGMVYVNGRLLKKNILVENGKIAGILPASRLIAADKTINAKGMVVIPGVIDPHVHFREPGMTHKEDFETGSFAAAAGGVTSFLDMPNTKPPTLTQQLLSEKIAAAAKKSVVNFGFHFGSSLENLEDIRKASGSAAVASVKIFMNASTGNMLIEDENAIKNIMESARITAIHAEGENAKKAIDIAHSLGRKFYMCHVSLQSELEYIKRNRKENVFAEVTPHHLFLTEKDENKFVKMKPSLKSEKDRASLWAALADGTIDAVGSDHAPHTPEEKEAGDVYGVPGVETRLPLMLDAFNRRRIEFRRLVELMCETPARIFRLKGKGFIKEGSDADLTIIDTKMVRKIRNDALFTKCGWSPFDGYELRGWPVQTVVNGNVVFENGEVCASVKGKVVEHG